MNPEDFALTYILVGAICFVVGHVWCHVADRRHMDEVYRLVNHYRAAYEAVKWKRLYPLYPGVVNEGPPREGLYGRQQS